MSQSAFFTQVYKTNAWGKGSGVGSAPEYTQRYRDLLQSLLQQHRIKRVLDVGSGDWQSTQLIDWTGIDYTGMDIVPDVIKAVAAAHGSDTVRFRCDDILTLPAAERPPADLLIVKDVLQHWLCQEIMQFIPIMRDYPFVLVTNDVEDFEKAITWSARWHPVDLTRPPFNLVGTPLLTYRVQAKDPPKVTMLFQQAH